MSGTRPLERLRFEIAGEDIDVIWSPAGDLKGLVATDSLLRLVRRAVDAPCNNTKAARLLQKLKELLAARDWAHPDGVEVLLTVDVQAGLLRHEAPMITSNTMLITNYDTPLLSNFSPKAFGQTQTGNIERLVIHVARKPTRVAALAAARCLLVVADSADGPVACRLLALTDGVLDAPVRKFSWRAPGGTSTDELATVPWATEAWYVGGDPTARGRNSAGRSRRERYLTSCRVGDLGEFPALAPVRSDATLRDSLDKCDPFVVLYYNGSGFAREATRLILSMRDAGDSVHVRVVDITRDFYGDHGDFPKNTNRLMSKFFDAAVKASSVGVRGNFNNETQNALLLSLIRPPSSIQVYVNGRGPVSVRTGDEAIAAPAGERVATIEVEVIVPSLAAPGARTREQKFWLEPEVPVLVDSAVAALEAGEEHPSKQWKKLKVLGKLGVATAYDEVRWLEILVALGGFPRHSISIPRQPRLRERVHEDWCQSLCRCARQLYDKSRACRVFLDELCPDLDARARKDALCMVVAKRFGHFPNSRRLIVHYLLEECRGSKHPHLVASRLVFAYWVAAGDGNYQLRGRSFTYEGPVDVVSAPHCREIVEAVLGVGVYDYSDYGTEGDAKRALRALADLAVLWTNKFDPDARVCYEAAGVAGNELAADIAARLAVDSPQTLKKLVRKYRLDAFATPHLETLPTGLKRLEAALFRISPDGDDENDERVRAARRARRAAQNSTNEARDAAAATAAATESFAVEFVPAGRTEPTKRELAVRERKAREREKAKERAARKKKADARRREQEEREAAAREEAAREAATRAPAPDADEAETASEASIGDDAVAATTTSLDAATADAPPDDGDWTDARSRRERRAAAAAADEEARAVAAAREAEERARAVAAAREAEARDAEEASLALARRLAAEDAIAPPPPAPMEEDGFRSFLGSLGLVHHADRLRAEAIESVDDLALLDRADIIACGVPAADAVRIEAALAELDQVGFEGAAVEESKSSEAVAPPPAGKLLVDEETYDDAAARAAALESSLTAHQSELRRLKGLLAERGIPDALVCPITTEIYEDPVMAADGFSYERRAIESWLGRGKRTSPKTNEEMPHTFLTPNRDLKAMCQEFLDDVRKFEAPC